MARIPCLITGTWRAARRRDGLLPVLFGNGIFNTLAYAAVSLNSERYQLTAVPSIALAVAIVLCGRCVTPAEPCVPSAT